MDYRPDAAHLHSRLRLARGPVDGSQAALAGISLPRTRCNRCGILLRHVCSRLLHLVLYGILRASVTFSTQARNRFADGVPLRARVERS